MSTRNIRAHERLSDGCGGNFRWDSGLRVSDRERTGSTMYRPFRTRTLQVSHSSTFGSVQWLLNVEPEQLVHTDFFFYNSEFMVLRPKTHWRTIVPFRSTCDSLSRQHGRVVTHFDHTMHVLLFPRLVVHSFALLFHSGHWKYLGHPHL
ncbi:hypothetical protein SCLCIDRAFT_683445 [Scleroderma citrinum Foug A]|uniref:Uncharacterized protein n=1 Tax=Scleroderma citrinum Foug A TaxID=1036808 RepID=A0A0C3D414_9AGAM|nr:hypothetical protein SCLCIDRAFT_683445 [Scleroderma citrinum Foug A]